jgi:hypothetical protein
MAANGRCAQVRFDRGDAKAAGFHKGVVGMSSRHGLALPRTLLALALTIRTDTHSPLQAVAIVVYYYCGQYVASPALGSAGPMIKKIAYGM